MGKTLIIAEKPSVAGDLARVLGKELGKFTRDKFGVFYQNDHAVITSALGHLLEQKKPMTSTGKSLPWKFDYLPAIPQSFELEPIKQSEERLKKILQLAKNKEVTHIVNACDAGREGELIFYNIARYGKWKKPVQRLWMQSMTDDAILTAWHNLRSEQDMLALTNAAVSRSEADWLVGLNSTRALTLLQSRGGFTITPAGRVQTPTLAILTQRELEIQAFQSTPYSEVWAQFTVPAGSYSARYIDTAWQKTDDPHSRPERIYDPALAAAVCERCQGKTGTVSEEKKPVSTVAPLLYDLTALQREAANRYGFSAKRTLQLAQECYEKYKVLTYPRTDSRYLPNDYIGKVRDMMGAIAQTMPPFAPFAQDILTNNRVKPNRRVFDTSKVSDHFAIIPTGNTANLGGDAQKIFEMVTARFLAVFFPPAVFEDTRRLTVITHPDNTQDTFLATGRILVEPGWQAVYGRTPGSSAKDELPPVQQNQTAAVQSIEVRNAMTKPPARYNEATLLAAMEGAGKLVDDDELAAAMSERGLGTPATRASIIEGLIAQKYIAREGRNLLATRRGVELIALLEQIGLTTLTSPSLTGEWEYRLKQMEQAVLPRQEFMAAITDLTKDIVQRVKDFHQTQQQEELPPLEVACPACQAQGLRNTLDAVSCRECKFAVRKVISGRDMSDDELRTLITEGRTPVLTGFSSRFGKPFDAGLELNPNFRAVFYFPPRDDAQEAEDATPQKITTVAIPGKGEHDVFETPRAWRIPTLTHGKAATPATIARQLLGREIPQDQVIKLLTTGKTDLLKGFISKHNKRPFDAYLTWSPITGKIAFEFPPRPGKTGDKAAKAADKVAKKAKSATASATKKTAAKSATKKTAAASKSPKTAKPKSGDKAKK